MWNGFRIRRSPKRQIEQMGDPGLQLTHAVELIPTGPEQRRHFPPFGDRFGRVAAMPESVAVTRLTADPISAAVKPTASPPFHRRRLARRSAPGSGIAAERLVQA